MANLLYVLKPLLGLLPEVEKPPRHKKVAFRDRAIWTGVVLLIYLICC